MEPLRVLCNHKLDTLDESWISSVWEAEFVNYQEPPDEYLAYLESNDAKLQLRETCHILKKWIAVNCDEQCKFSWQDLMVLGINVRGLLAVLDYIMKTGQRVGSDMASRQACLDATSLYLMLLTVPGSSVFSVYHPCLYERTMKTLKMSESIFSSRQSSARETAGASSLDDDDQSEQPALSHSEKVSLVRGISRIICDLMTMLKLFRLKERQELLDLTIRTLLDIMRLVMYTDESYDNQEGLNSDVGSLSKKAFAALRELCSGDHESVTLTIMLIAQYMLPHLLLQQTNSHQPKMTVVHETFIYFLKTVLDIHSKETSVGIITLIHQLMVRYPERSEGRQRQATVVVKLLNICDKNTAVAVFRDITSYSHSGKFLHRLFAQEIVEKLFRESELLRNDRHGDTSMKMRRILVAIILSRCMDRSPLVRGRAMATLASLSDCNDDTDRAVLKGIFGATAANKRFATIADMVNAFEDTDPLPGSDTLIAMLLDRVNDERAMVRRSGLKILRNLSVMFPSIAGRMTHVISERCRDPMLSVRQFAVHVLSEILQHFPHDSALLHEWTQAVVPQIYDVESKVQEKVLECLHDVLINRIGNASACRPDSLPWRVLDKLNNMRMRKHLSRACGLWVKCNVISKSVISNLQSHVGTGNNIGAWILLAALAENMTIPGIGRYIADYENVVCKNDLHASLVLHVLRHAWPCLDRERLQDLCRYLYARMCSFQVNFNLISVCLDICHNVLQHLHDRNVIESYMAELVELSETKVRDILKEDGEAHKMRVIFTLGHASLLCTSRISKSTLQVLRTLLLDPLATTKRLQTAAVVLLCQQALRERDVAKRVTPVLGELIRRETGSTKAAVKINAAKALADICVRFTTLVEPYLPDMCVSMKDPDPAVREAVIVIFIQLLLEDYIKVKGPFFFHILTMLSDTNSMIRELTVFLVEERLLMKNKALISQQFLASIYYYNNYHGGDAVCRYRMRDRDKQALTLPGRANRDKRRLIYEFMLDHLDPPAKFKLLVGLTKYILAEICDGKSIDVRREEDACVLQDALFVISNHRLQLSSTTEKHKDDSHELDETVESSQNTSTSAANNNAINIIATNMKKHNLDNLLPTLITLKKKLHASPLESSVERLLFKVYSDFEKKHLLSLLNEYPELEKDMECYQRRVRGRSTSENDDDDEAIGSSPPTTPTICHDKDSPVDVSRRTSLRGVSSPSPLPSTSGVSSCTSGRLSSSNCSRISSPYDKLMKNVSVRLVRLSPARLSLCSSFSTSTPKAARDQNPGTSYSPSTYVRRVKKPPDELRPSLDRSPPRKSSRRSNV
ncbi:PREDICTED: condensin-2 complex subunit D3 isoform X1 [Dinoponera quadriceps]|uniref:Condensin-2 complex subunit D3 isoform X1 n=1 Tax=Dinoponera quadriceps TaxID=609295 RepID=A0A6P3X3F3_DINQU|nr:PREDICTED: condensin-2 complex subunit D3 isoform X1 [Dinoponera quadriceps]